jgi:hypothetical protein
MMKAFRAVPFLLAVLVSAGSVLAQTNVEDPLQFGQCRLEAGYALPKFTRAFREATPATKNVAIVSDPTLRTRAATLFADTGGEGTWWVHVNESLLCPGPQEAAAGIGISDMIEKVAVHEACHIVRQGARLKDPRPIGTEERMRLEMDAESCATQLIAAWNEERAAARSE